MNSHAQPVDPKPWGALVPALICAWPARWTPGQRIVRGILLHDALSLGYALALTALGVTIGTFWY